MEAVSGVFNRKSIQVWEQEESLLIKIFKKHPKSVSSPLFSNSLFSSVAVFFCAVFTDNRTLLCFLGHVQNQPLAPDLHIH